LLPFPGKRSRPEMSLFQEAIVARFVQAGRMASEMIFLPNPVRQEARDMDIVAWW
jgi:hypothetical protein